MYGTINLNVPLASEKHPEHPRGYIKYKKKIYQHNWDNLNIKSYIQDLYHNYGKNTSIASKSSSNLAAMRNRGRSSSLVSTASSSSGISNYHTLVKGNYEFPFSAVLPGSLNESVEGLPYGSHSYTIEAVIERDKYSTDLSCKKNIRLVRTLRPDALELHESVVVENTWPAKVDYSISVPSKAVPIGSIVPINISIIPLTKGLRLGLIKITLLEIFQLMGNPGTFTKHERIVTKMKIKDPKKYLSQYLENENYDMENLQFQDKWEVDMELPLPPSLSKSTQDCTILRNIKVTHKLKFVICLINSDGHVSELRASLPLVLFISPFLTLGVNTLDNVEANPIKYSHDAETNNLVNSSIFGDDNSRIFTTSASNMDLCIANSEISSETPMCDLMAPPNYEKHVFDKLYSGNSINIPEHHESSSIDLPLSVDALQGRVRGLTIESRNSNVPSIIVGDVPDNHEATSIDGDNRDIASVDSLVTSRRLSNISRKRFRSNTILSIGSLNERNSILTNFSRESSFTTLNHHSMGTRGDWEINSLSQVPSYDNALKEDIVEDELPPDYPVSAGLNPNINMDFLPPSRPQISHQKSSLSLVSNNTDGLNITTSLNRSNNASNVSLDMLSMNSSSAYLNVPIGTNSSTAPSSSSKFFGINFSTGYGSNNSKTNNEDLALEINGQRRESNKTSFANIMGKITRRDKK